MKQPKFILCLAFFILTATASAQPPFDQEVDDVPAAALPGIAFVVAAGLACGIKALRNTKG